MLKQFSKQDIIRHFIAWICVAAYFILFSSISGSLISKIIWNLVLLFNFLFSYYISLLYILPNLIEKRKIHFLSLFTLLICIFIGIYVLLIDFITPYCGATSALYRKPLNIKIPKFLINFSYVIFASIGTYYNRLGRKKVLEAEEMDQNLIKLELMILKSQFHSHLTFNFLNFCYNKIRSSSSKTAISIEEFAFMLRYSLKEQSQKLISLKTEIEYIEHFISFQKCLTDNLFVDFQYEGEMASVYIPPKILIVFIENAFKHGISDNPQAPIIILIKSFQTDFFFSIYNCKANKINLTSSGIGLENIKKILTLYYTDNYSLKVKNTNNSFLCELTIRHQSINSYKHEIL
jgi:sensor histidine kinase YesM